MLKKSSRLPAGEFRSGDYATARTPYFLLKEKTSADKKNRIGIVAGVAVHKSAVKRNFWKRQSKAVLSSIQFSGKPSGHDLLLILSPKVNTLTREEFRKQLLGAAAKLIK